MSGPVALQPGFHDRASAGALRGPWTHYAQHWQFSYRFTNAFHPFASELIRKLTRESLPRMCDAGYLNGLAEKNKDVFTKYYQFGPARIDLEAERIDVSAGGWYGIYNLELLLYMPWAIAVHLSKNRRFAEADRQFRNFILDPMSNDPSVPFPQRSWKFLGFRYPGPQQSLDQAIQLLSTPKSALSATDQSLQEQALQGYGEILRKPFQPFAVARTRQVAFQYAALMAYLDNLIALGDDHFQQYTPESVHLASQVYSRVASVLGERPQQVPASGNRTAKTFAQLRAAGIGPFGDALVQLEGKFPFNLNMGQVDTSSDGAGGGDALFGIGRTLYFCIPRNDKLLGYWDTIADRQCKVRHCMDINGVVRPLPLYEPRIDPALLVKALAAGLDIGSVVSGLNQPVGPVRALPLIQKALELCNEVRALGTALLAALEKGDAEHLALMRQRQEIQIQQLSQEVRFLQWKAAQQATTAALAGREAVVARADYYKRLLGLPDRVSALRSPDRRELTEENFDEAYAALVGQYEKEPSGLLVFAPLRLANQARPDILSGYAGSGNVNLTINEDAELNKHLPAARDARFAASLANQVASTVSMIPDINVNAEFWGLGATTTVFGGKKLADAIKATADVSQTIAAWEQDQAAMASRFAGYERRADEWLQQHNQAVHELRQIGRQILGSLIAEQAAYREYSNARQQVTNAQEVNQFLHDRFCNEELYVWMQGELSGRYYEYCRLAIDTARKAERTMKYELMRPALDAQDFVKFNYGDPGRKGLLAGEALWLDVKRMELAYYENNQRELELTKHVSLRQLDPLALLTLKSFGTCRFTIPEWLYDLDCRDHYMRRIKWIALTIPAVAGPYTGVHCTLSLLGSRLRRSPLLQDGAYAAQGWDDDRIIVYNVAVESIVTSTAQNDSGMFAAGQREDQFLPFQGQGAECTCRLDMPKDLMQFDRATITDVIVHVQYTARRGVDPDAVTAELNRLFAESDQAVLFLGLSLRQDFPTEWAAFLNAGAGHGDFSATIRREHFPYFAQHNRTITITRLELYGADVSKHHEVGQSLLDAANAQLADQGAATISIPPDPADTRAVLTRSASDVSLIVSYRCEGGAGKH